MTKTPQHHVPELRFLEFEGEWEEKKLGDIASFSKGKSLSKKDISENGVACILYGELYTKYGAFVKEIFSKTSFDKSTLVRGKENQILIPSSGETSEDIATASCITTDKEVYIGGDINIITPKNDNGRFISLSLNSVNKNEIAKYAQGKSVVHLYNDHLKKTKVKMPNNLSEQEKIGTFFSKLDLQIELEEKKLELLEQQKKGYMQKIFSQELRFKDENGDEYPEWEIEKLGNLIYEVNEKTTSNNQYILLSSTKKGLLTQEEYFKKQIGSKDSTGYKILRFNQLVLSPQNLWLGNINLNQRFDIGIVSPSYRIYNLTRNFDINFAKNLLKSPRYIYEYAQASEQGASVVRRNLNLDLFYSIKISLPQIEEQERIGEFLDKLDNLIKTQSTKLDYLKQLKQALLQKMFV